MCAISKQAVLKGMNDIAVNGEVLRLKWKIKWTKKYKHWSCLVEMVNRDKIAGAEEPDTEEPIRYIFPITPNAVLQAFTSEEELKNRLIDLGHLVYEEIHKELMWNDELQMFERRCEF